MPGAPADSARKRRTPGSWFSRRVAVDVARVLRVRLVHQLDEAGSDGLTCGQLDLPVGKSTCSHHLKVLLHAGVTTEREEGTRKYVRLRRDELDARFPGVVGSVLASA